MGISRRFLKLVAEKNLLKLVLTNRQTTLQVVHNRSGNVFLQARRAARAVKLSPAKRRPPSGRGQATSLEKAVREGELWKATALRPFLSACPLA